MKCDLIVQIAVLEEQKKEITEIEEDDKIDEDDKIEEDNKVEQEEKVDEDKTVEESSEKITEVEEKPDINDVPMEDIPVKHSTCNIICFINVSVDKFIVHAWIPYLLLVTAFLMVGFSKTDSLS